jgi:hypothetical protein
MKTYVRYTLVTDEMKQDSILDLDEALKKSAEHEVRESGAGTPVASAISWAQHLPVTIEGFDYSHLWLARVVVAVSE